MLSELGLDLLQLVFDFRLSDHTDIGLNEVIDFRNVRENIAVNLDHRLVDFSDGETSSTYQTALGPVMRAEVDVACVVRGRARYDCHVWPASTGTLLVYGFKTGREEVG